jgi:hypothetical protein
MATEDMTPTETAPAATEAAAPAASTEVSAVVQAHITHAQGLGLYPGRHYMVEKMPLPASVGGVLVGTNDVGVLMLADGATEYSLHPWGEVRALTVEG